MNNPPPLEKLLPSLLRLWRQTQKHPVAGPLPVDGLTTEEADRIAEGVRTLSKGLTGERTLVGSPYLSEENLLGAYLLYYWPVSFAQTLAVLRRAKIKSTGRALDLGSGPAPGAFALLEAGWKDVSIADRSAKAVEYAQNLAGMSGRILDAHVWESQKGAALPAGRWDLILLGHFMNELWPEAADRVGRRADFLQNLSKSLTDQGRFLVVEPASHKVNADVLTLRDELVRRGWFVEGPCFRQETCPALAEGAACHDVLFWKVPHLVAQTARRAAIDKRTISFTWFVFSPRKPETVTTDSSYRVVSEPLLNKAGRKRFLICGKEGRFSFSAPPGFRTPVWNSLRRGDALNIHRPEKRQTGWGVAPDTRIEPIS